MLVTKQTAADIWNAYREIENGEKLVVEMEKALKDGEDPNPRDAFGRRQCLQLGVPMGDNSHRLLDLAPKLAIAVIKAHVAEKRAFLELASERARSELETR